MIVSLCNLTGISVAILPRYLSNYDVIESLKPTLAAREIPISCGKTSVGLVNRGLTKEKNPHTCHPFYYMGGDFYSPLPRTQGRRDFDFHLFWWTAEKKYIWDLHTQEKCEWHNRTTTAQRVSNAEGIESCTVCRATKFQVQIQPETIDITWAQLLIKSWKLSPMSSPYHVGALRSVEWNIHIERMRLTKVLTRKAAAQFLCNVGNGGI